MQYYRFWSIPTSAIALAPVVQWCSMAIFLRCFFVWHGAGGERCPGPGPVETNFYIYRIYWIAINLRLALLFNRVPFFLCGLHRWTNVIHEKGSSWGVSPYYPSCWMLTSACQGPPLKRLQVPQENWSMSVHVLPIAIMLSGFIWFYHAIWYMVLSFLSICSPLLRCHPFFPMVHSVHSLRISHIIPIPQRKIAHAHGEGRRGKTCQNGRDRRPAASAQLIGPDGQFTNGIWMDLNGIL